MTKYFCDKCGVEITDRNQCVGGFNGARRLGTSVRCDSGKLGVELLHTWDGESNGGVFCKYCILDAFLSLDDRPGRQRKST